MESFNVNFGESRPKVPAIVKLEGSPMPKSRKKQLTEQETGLKLEVKSPKGESGRTKEKEKKPIVEKVSKVINKSRRRLSEDKFEKELQRTIQFLEEIKSKLHEAPAPEKIKRSGKCSKSK
jgi:hypothetical protein